MSKTWDTRRQRYGQSGHSPAGLRRLGHCRIPTHPPRQVTIPIALLLSPNWRLPDRDLHRRLTTRGSATATELARYMRLAAHGVRHALARLEMLGVVASARDGRHVIWYVPDALGTLRQQAQRGKRHIFTPQGLATVMRNLEKAQAARRRLPLARTCQRGHLWTPENTYVRRHPKKGRIVVYRMCRECDLSRHKSRRARARIAA